MPGRTHSQERVIGFSGDAIAEGQSRASDFRQCRFYPYNIVVMRSLGVAAGDLNHRKVKSLLFDGGIRQTNLSQELRSSFFEPAQVVGIVDNTHLIGVAIDNSNRRNVREMTPASFISYSPNAFSLYSQSPLGGPASADLIQLK